MDKRWKDVCAQLCESGVARAALLFGAMLLLALLTTTGSLGLFLSSTWWVVSRGVLCAAVGIAVHKLIEFWYGMDWPAFTFLRMFGGWIAAITLLMWLASP